MYGRPYVRIWECSLVIADPGDYTLTAAYSGAENDPICPDTEAHTVIQAETSIALISDLPDPSLPGQPFTMTFKVTSIWGTPTGTVTVTASENGPGCTGLLKAGSGSCPLTLTEAGKYTLTATYLGDEFNLASADSGPHNVKGKTTTSLPDPPHPSLPGQPFTVTFSVASAWGTPTGAVTVTALGSDASCSGELVGGSGSCSLALAQPGEYNLLAAYPGDEGHFASRYIKPHTVSRIHVYLPVTVK